MKLKTTLATTLTLGLLATSAVTVAAQTEESPSGTHFKGIVSFEETYEAGTAAQGILEDVFCGPHDEPANIIVDDIMWNAIIEATDHRISGSMDAAFSALNCIVDEDHAASAFWVEYRITNDEGSWTGGGPGYYAGELEWEDPRSLVYFHTMTGEDAYEGLTAVFLRQRNAWNEEGPPTHIVNGVIVAGDIPPASDFDGSADALEGLVPDPRIDHEEEGDEEEEEFEEEEDAPAEIPEAVLPVEAALGEAAASFEVSETWVGFAGTLGDFLDTDLGDDEMADVQARMRETVEAVGVDGHAVQNYYFGAAEGLFEGMLDIYEGADPDVLAEVMHPDNRPFMIPLDAPTDTVAEEPSYGGQTVFRFWNEGVPMYFYISGDQVLTIFNNEPDMAPYEEAVDAFFTALLGPAE